ncbi:MAG: hypothetical protein M3022_13750, partial [Actinomycetota bacterium]|nr:hypothetical protein [Actinomycetota bacterium]
GVRSNWVFWQSQVFASSDDFVSLGDPDEYGMITTYRVRDSQAGNVKFGSLGYAAAALKSYRTFERLKAAGVIGSDVRFQVSLPTPVAVVAIFVAPEDRAAVEGPYEIALRRELTEILDQIPPSELAIQWDVAVEFGMLEHAVFDSWWDDPMAGIIQRLIVLGDAVPDHVALGYHLCYGDAGHEHFAQPRDATFLASVAQAVSDGVSRRITFIHLPVPRNRSDAEYFSPLARLNLPAETKLYLGLVHVTDGVDGATKRLAAARQFVERFGVATECGFGRRPPETVAGLLRLHGEVLDAAGA